VTRRAGLALALALLCSCQQLAGLGPHVLERDGSADADAAPDASEDAPARSDGPAPVDALDARTLRDDAAQREHEQEPTDTTPTLDGTGPAEDAAVAPDSAEAAVDAAADVTAVGPDLMVAGPDLAVDLPPVGPDVADASGPPPSCKPYPVAEPECSAGLAKCGGAECLVDLSVDPRNCGECGHSCGDGACASRDCAPLVMADSLNLEYKRVIAANATGVYWGTVGGTVFHRSYDNREPVTELAVGEGLIHGIVLDADFAYLLTEQASCTGWCLRRVPLVKGRPGHETLADVGYFSGGLAVDDNNLYWFDSTGTNGRSIVRLPIRGAAAPVRREIATGQGIDTTAIAIDDLYIYWGTINSDLPHDTVMRARLDGNTSTAPELVASGLTRPYGIAVDRWNVYWSENGDQGTGRIQMKSKQSGTITTIAEDQLYPLELSVDDQNVYFGAGQNISPGIHRVPMCSGTPRGAAVQAAGGRVAGGIVSWNGTVYANDKTSVFRFAP
jgi:hypothetical protein